MYNSDYYKILNVAQNATDAEIKASFIKVRQGAAPAEIQRMNEAYKVLSDANERAKYDQWYKNQSGSSSSSGGSPVPPTPSPIPQQGTPTGAPSVKQVKILNLDNLSTRVIAVNNIDDNKFPPAQYCDNGLYYGLEKNNNISLCNKTQWDSLYRQVIKATTRGQKQPTFGSANLKKLIIWAVVFVLFIFAITKCSNDDTSTSSTSTNDTNYTQSNSSYSTSTPEVEKEPEVEYVEVEKPANGTTSHTYDVYDNNTSSLEIELPTSSSNTYYYVKLVEPTTKNVVQSVFLYPGEKIDILVPCGSYNLMYASGTKWYGYDKLFGPYGGYGKAYQPLEFTREYGHIISLQPTVNGNLTTGDVSFEDFQ